MKDLNVQSRFIEMRAVGRSYSEIAAELKVSKTTLIEWSKRYRTEVSNMRAMEQEAFYKRLKVNSEALIEAHAVLLARLLDEATRRDLESLQTDKLIELILKTSSHIANKAPPAQFRADSPLFELVSEVEWAG